MGCRELALQPLTITAVLIGKYWFSVLRLEKVHLLFSADKNRVQANTSMLTRIL